MISDRLYNTFVEYFIHQNVGENNEYIIMYTIHIYVIRLYLWFGYNVALLTWYTKIIHNHIVIMRYISYKICIAYSTTTQKTPGIAHKHKCMVKTKEGYRTVKRLSSMVLRQSRLKYVLCTALFYYTAHGIDSVYSKA